MLVSRDRVPVILDVAGRVYTGLTAMSKSQEGEYRWYVVDPSLFSGYKSGYIDSFDLQRWRVRYPAQCCPVGMSLNGELHPWHDDNAYLLGSLLEAQRISEFLNITASLTYQSS